MSFFNVMHITCNRLNINYLVQQIAQSVINSHFVFYDVSRMCFGLYQQGLIQAETCRRDIINDKCLFFTDCMQFVGLNTAIISEHYVL